MILNRKMRVLTGDLPALFGFFPISSAIFHPSPWIMQQYLHIANRLRVSRMKSIAHFL